MLKDFKDDDQSNSGIVRFSRLIMWCIPRLTIFTRSLSFYLKKNLRRFHNEKKRKTDLEVLSKSFAFC